MKPIDVSDVVDHVFRLLKKPMSTDNQTENQVRNKKRSLHYKTALRGI